MKTVQFKLPNKASDPVDAWVQSHSEVAPPAVPSEPMKRFTIDVAASLHVRIKAQCALRGVKMADVIRDLLEREFPKS